MVEHLKTDLSTAQEYTAEYAQADAQQKGTAKGPELKLGYDWNLVTSVTHLNQGEKIFPLCCASRVQHPWLAECDTHL
jgi:hypothetical protein